MWNDRTKLLLGEEGLSKLKSASVAVIGIGGVGGWACEFLVRAGLGKLTIVDFDKIDETNINRQIVANVETVGRNKVDVMAENISKINSNCMVSKVNEKICKENVEKILTMHKFDYVIDAIDNVTDKIELICFCKSYGLNIISAMGAGNRIGIPNFKVMDIYKTSNDGLARVLRKKLRENGVTKLDVVISDAVGLKIDKREQSVGSISYYPAMCGAVLSAYVIEKLTK